MIRVLSKEEMAYWDSYTIQEKHIPGLVLMERAALGVCEAIEDLVDTQAFFDGNVSIQTGEKKNKIGIICGPGNNGGDGVAIGRLLKLKGFESRIYILGNPDKYTEQLKQEIDIAKAYQVSFVDNKDALYNCDILVDAIFGIGLAREVTGEYKEAISYINTCAERGARIVAVDIPSGYNADTGEMLGIGVKADITVTFGYVKKGLLLGDCYLNLGELILKDVGIYEDNDKNLADGCYTIEDTDLNVYIPKGSRSDNKGSKGKTLIIAGSEDIYGACYLSAKAALKTGCGLVKIYTHKNNIAAIQTNLPEAMYLGYETYDEAELVKLLSWADAVLIGPGLGTGEISEQVLETVVNKYNGKLIVDADGINLLAKNKSLLETLRDRCIITPHLKEMSRLCDREVSDISTDMEAAARDFYDRYRISIDLKNFTSFIVSAKGCFINTTGNEGMATAGSGDVLAGIMVSLLAQGTDWGMIPALATYIHGKAGEKASVQYGKKQMLASDIISCIDI